ncbi:BMC domain-containing protein [Neomoorella carbonis]|jgi:microcompartment protein CcmL/EutN|uniref:BMC domain-containing protein n=1 Tax=Neomoorella carbonis TaxID=3062783 RepID=UPI003255FD18
MKHALGLIEYKSIARGVMAADAMLKAGNVELIQATVLCPGKFIALIAGAVGAVEVAVERGFSFDPAFAIAKFILPNVHPAVFPALTATNPVELKGSFGIIETIDAASAVVAGDTAAKSGRVELIEIRLARGMGGKAVVFLCGELAAVEAAVKSVQDRLRDEGVIIATSIISSPHPDLAF